MSTKKQENKDYIGEFVYIVLRALYRLFIWGIKNIINQIKSIIPKQRQSLLVIEDYQEPIPLYDPRIDGDMKNYEDPIQSLVSFILYHGRFEDDEFYNTGWGEMKGSSINSLLTDQGYFVSSKEPNPLDYLSKSKPKAKKKQAPKNKPFAGLSLN
jgi:hypothetical protein